MQERFQQHCISLNVTYEGEMRAVFIFRIFCNLCFFAYFCKY
ncbi:hypothetical protein M067_4199 [Bacteroides fragilis str. J-143-4]|nr:hypothetical protein M067_4199 [Bacteroides fragilis str. J-143-4]